MISLGPTLDTFLLDFTKEIRIVISCPDLSRKIFQKVSGKTPRLPYSRGQDLEAMVDQMDGSQNS